MAAPWSVAKRLGRSGSAARIRALSSMLWLVRVSEWSVPTAWTRSVSSWWRTYAHALPGPDTHIADAINHQLDRLPTNDAPNSITHEPDSN
jgi:hypothetical protein